MQPDVYFKQLKTEKFIIRRIQSEDNEQFCGYRSDEIASRYQVWDLPFTTKEAKDLISEQRMRHPDMPGQTFLCGIFLQIPELFIGECSLLTDTIDHRQIELGLSIRPEFKKSSFANEIVNALFSYLFIHLKKNKIKIYTDVQDTAFNRILEKIGMLQEAKLLENAYYRNTWHDQYLYSMLQVEWQSNHKSLNRSLNHETSPNKAI